MSINNIILTTGGTGGHIFPAIAVAEEIRKRNPHAAILFLGSKYGIEADVVANAGFRFAGLPARGIMGKGLRGVVNALAMFRSVTSSLSDAPLKTTSCAWVWWLRRLCRNLRRQFMPYPLCHT